MKMKIRVEKLLGAVLLAERVVGKKESLPILSCILIEARKNNVRVKATNLESGLEIVIPGDVGVDGVVAVPAAILSQTLRSISGEMVECSVEEGNLAINTKKTKTLIKAVPHDEFPLLLKTTEEGGVSIPKQELIKIIQSVSYAASPSMVRPELGSIFISMNASSMLSVATDSFRLAEKAIPMHGKGSVELLIPLKHAQELARILEYVVAETVSMFAGDSQVVVRADGVSYVSRVIEGNFPNYKEILPKSFMTEATLLKGEFADMLRKARVFAGSDQHVGLHVYPKRKVFSATAHNTEVGEMSDVIDAALTGEDIDINFHIGYLGDCLASIEADSITLGFSGAGKPLVMRGASDASFTYLVMPLNR